MEVKSIKTETNEQRKAWLYQLQLKVHEGDLLRHQENLKVQLCLEQTDFVREKIRTLNLAIYNSKQNIQNHKEKYLEYLI